MVKRLRRILIQYWFLIGLIIAYTIIFYFICLFRYQHYQAGLFDLGHMNNVLWNTVHGRIFMISDYNGKRTLAPRLTDHADLLLLLLTPIYFIFQNVATLLFAQAFVVSLGCIPVFLYTKIKTTNKFLPYFFATAYLFLPGVENATRYDYHSVTLGATFLLFAFYFFSQKKYRKGIPFLILLLLTKEEVGFTIALFCFFFAFCDLQIHSLSSFFTVLKAHIIKHKRRFMIMAEITLLGLLYTVVMIEFIIPLSREGQQSSYVSDYLGSKGGVIGVLSFMILHPIQELKVNFPANLDYFVKLFAPFGWISFFSPLILFIALPEFILDILSLNPSFHSIYFQYSALINPIVTLAAISSFVKIDFYLKKRFQSYRTSYFVGYLVLCLAFASYFWATLPYSNQFYNSFNPKYDANDITELNRLAKTIPSSVAVTASQDIGTHFSSRKNVFLYPNATDWADYIIVDKFDSSLNVKFKGYTQIYKGSEIAVYKSIIPSHS